MVASAPVSFDAIRYGISRALEKITDAKKQILFLKKQSKLSTINGLWITLTMEYLKFYIIKYMHLFTTFNRKKLNLI